MMFKGHCFCKYITWTACAEPLWQGYCHCESCRRATSAPVVAWMGFDKDAVTFSTPPKVFVSSKGVERGFCGDCGAPMFFKSHKWPDEIHLYAASLDNPELAKPTEFFHYDEKLSWLQLQNELE